MYVSASTILCNPDAIYMHECMYVCNPDSEYCNPDDLYICRYVSMLQQEIKQLQSDIQRCFHMHHVCNPLIYIWYVFTTIAELI